MVCVPKGKLYQLLASCVDGAECSGLEWKLLPSPQAEFGVLLKNKFFFFCLVFLSFFLFADTAGNTRVPSGRLDSSVEAAWRLPGWTGDGTMGTQDPQSVSLEPDCA